MTNVNHARALTLKASIKTCNKWRLGLFQVSYFIMRKLSLLSLVLLLLYSCTKTQYIPVETTVIDTLRITKIQRDSVYCRDSIFVDKYRNGDTVYIVKTNTRIMYKNVYHNDTIYRSVTNDSLNADAAKALADISAGNNEKMLKLKQNKKTIFSLYLIIVLLSCVAIVLLKRKNN